MKHIAVLASWLLVGGLLAVCTLTWLAQRTLPYTFEQPIVVTSQGKVVQPKGTIAIVHTTTSGQEIRIALVNPATASVEVITTISLHFQQEDAQSKVSTHAVSIQGDSVLESEWADSQNLLVQVNGAVPDSYTVLVLDAPAGYFATPLAISLGNFFMGLPLVGWAVLASLLVIGVLIVITYRGRQVQWQEGVEQPLIPARLTLMEMALLHHATVQPSDLIALLYQLASRGYLDIVEQEGTVLFLRRAKNDTLSNYERNLLLLLFPQDTHVPARLSEVISSINRELFSAVVSQIYLDIYDGFTKKGYFTDNPRFIHLRYKTAAIIGQLLGLLIAVFGYFAMHATPGIIILGGGVYLASYLLYQATYRIRPFARKSKMVITELSQFIGYLRSKKPIGPEGRQGYLFYEYLPYALVTDSAVGWRERFRGIRWYIPEWYQYLESNIIDPDSFVNRIQQVAGEISSAMAEVRDPNVD